MYLLDTNIIIYSLKGRPKGRGIDKECFAVTPQAAGYQTQSFAMKLFKKIFVGIETTFFA